MKTDQSAMQDLVLPRTIHTYSCVHELIKAKKYSNFLDLGREFQSECDGGLATIYRHADRPLRMVSSRNKCAAFLGKCYYSHFHNPLHSVAQSYLNELDDLKSSRGRVPEKQRVMAFLQLFREVSDAKEQATLLHDHASLLYVMGHYAYAWFYKTLEPSGRSSADLNVQEPRFYWAEVTKLIGEYADESENGRLTALAYICLTCRMNTLVMDYMDIPEKQRIDNPRVFALYESHDALRTYKALSDYSPHNPFLPRSALNVASFSYSEEYCRFFWGRLVDIMSSKEAARRELIGISDVRAIQEDTDLTYLHEVIPESSKGYIP